MIAPINDGGPAFASPGIPAFVGGVPVSPWSGHGWSHDPQPGMSLRAYFAARCPLTLDQSAQVYGMELPEILRYPEHTRCFLAIDADMRCAWADALIAELSNPQ